MRVWIDTGSARCRACGGHDSELVHTLGDSDTALLDYLTQARYGADAAPLIDGKGSATIADAAALLMADVDAHPQGDTPKGQRARVLLARFVVLAAAYPLATWHAT